MKLFVKCLNYVEMMDMLGILSLVSTERLIGPGPALARQGLSHEKKAFSVVLGLAAQRTAAREKASCLIMLDHFRLGPGGPSDYLWTTPVDGVGRGVWGGGGLA